VGARALQVCPSFAPQVWFSLFSMHFPFSSRLKCIRENQRAKEGVSVANVAAFYSIFHLLTLQRYAHPSPFTTHERRLREPQRCLPGRSCVKGRRTVKAEGRNELSRVQRLNAARIPSSFNLSTDSWI
jgi:hypothetical protein